MLRPLIVASTRLLTISTWKDTLCKENHHTMFLFSVRSAQKISIILDDKYYRHKLAKIKQKTKQKNPCHIRHIIHKSLNNLRKIHVYINAMKFQKVSAVSH